MTDGPQDELQQRRAERERERHVDASPATDDLSDATGQAAAVARARESFALSQPRSDVPVPDDRPIEDEQADNRS
jgi:hypothetical protein